MSADINNGLFLTEYTSLRDEIYKRSEFMHQRESLAITIWGAILAFGLSADSSSKSVAHIEAILLYPWIAYFLSAGWLFNLNRVRQIGRFLKELETKVFHTEDHLHWENWFHEDLESNRINNRQRFHVFEFLGSGGIFIGTQLATLIVAPIAKPDIFTNSLDRLDFILLILSGSITALTIIDFRRDIFRVE